MSDKTLIIEYDPFDMESRISIYENGRSQYDKVSSDLHEIGIYAISWAHNSGFTNIKIHAPSHVFDKLSKIMRTYENLQPNYAKDEKIEIEEI